MKKHLPIIIGIILIDIWLLWSDRKDLIKDYYFVTESVNKTNATVFSTESTTGETEEGAGNSTKVITYDIGVYSYIFSVNGFKYKNTDYSIGEIPSQSTPFNIIVEYVEKDPKYNRIEEFSLIKTKFDFFKEYIMFKLIVLAIVLVFIFIVIDNEKKKTFKN